MRSITAVCFAVTLPVFVSCSDRHAGYGRTDRDPLKLVEATNLPLPQPGIFLIPRPAGDAATNQIRTLERIRHLPKQQAAFEARIFTERGGRKESMRYLLFKQPNATGTSLPLVLSLHGGGPRHRFEDLLEPYAPGFAYGLGRLISAETQHEHPCFVVAPWSQERGWDDGNLRLVLAMMESLRAEFQIDPARIYVTGQSMGGFGTWSIITQHPELFAAAIPICGGGDPGRAAKVKAMPIWAFHGNADNVVPVENTRGMIRSLLAAGGTPIYWEYNEGTHAETAERAYCEPELISWLFAQRKH